MKIKTKLLLITGFSTLAIVALSIFLYFSLHSYNLAIEKNNITDQIAHNIFENNLLLSEYLLYYENRPRDLWVNRNDNIVALLKSQSAKFSKDSEKEIINTLLEVIGKSQKTFLELLAFQEEGSKGGAEQQAQLSAQLLINNQEAVSSIGQLKVTSAQDATFAQKTVVYFLVGFVALIFIIVVVILYFIWLSFVKPLVELKDATIHIAALDFSTTTTTTTTTTTSGGELGELGRAFNQMVVKLKDSYASLENRTQDLKNASIATQNVLEDLNIEKSKLEMINAKDEAMLDGIGDGVVVVDRDLKITLINKAAEAATGWSCQEVLGKIWPELIVIATEDEEPVPSKKWPLFLAVHEGKTITTSAATITYLYTRKDKTKFPVAITVSPIKVGGEIIGAILIFRDVTRERAIDKAKTEFVSLASHQLRTPLSVVNWYTEMLITGDAGKVNKEQKKYLDEVYRGNQRMVMLVNALLNVSRLELGIFSVEPKQTDVVKLAQSVINELKIQIDQKKLKFDEQHEELPLLNADPKLLSIVFQNLLSNAVKYTPEKGTINVDLRLVKRGALVDSQKANEDSIVIVVSDTGYGIPKNQQDKIFTKLFRADNAREKDTEGTGLGLYIVKSIIDHSDGRIWFESEENKGTTFYVTLPLAGMKRKKGTKELK